MLSELEHLNLPISKLRGQSYDGAANMYVKSIYKKLMAVKSLL